MRGPYMRQVHAIQEVLGCVLLYMFMVAFLGCLRFEVQRILEPRLLASISNPKAQALHP